MVNKRDELGSDLVPDYLASARDGGFYGRLRQPRGQGLGRPVGVALDRCGALLAADDMGNTIWRATAQ